MTPDELARLHARAMDHGTPWSADAFGSTLSQPGVFLVTAPPPSARKYPGERERQSLSHRAQRDLAGFALGRVAADEAELLTFAVDPAHRRRGVGRALLDDFVGAAAALGARHAFLEVAEDNTPALALYRRAGWSETARRAGYYARPGCPASAALVMTRAIDA